jgi:hypothetical protein
MRFKLNSLIAFVCVLLLACVAFGAPPEIIELSPIPKQTTPTPPPMPDTLSVGKYRWLGITGYDGTVTWQVDSRAALSFETDAPTKAIGIVEGQSSPTVNDVPAKALVLYGTAEGVTRVEAWGVVEGKAKRLAVKVFGGEGPRPPPDPKPDVDPTPSPAPIPGDGLRVLVVYESMATLPAAQSAAIYGQEMRDYLNAKCPKGPDGRTPEYRIYDKDTPMDNESKVWKDAMARKRDSIPWLIVSNGKTGFEGPLPATLAETMKILKQHGGQ